MSSDHRKPSAAAVRWSGHAKRGLVPFLVAADPQVRGLARVEQHPMFLPRGARSAVADVADVAADVERVTANAATLDVGEGQRDTQNAPAVDLDADAMTLDAPAGLPDDNAMDDVVIEAREFVANLSRIGEAATETT